jgi:oxalate decarboxylase/phosphoglucose isomerase-like protein (cupin superfamily)
LAGGGELVSGRFAIGPIIDHSQHFRLSQADLGEHVIVVVYIPRGTVHRNQNLSGQPVRTVELMIVDKDKPHTEPVN